MTPTQAGDLVTPPQGAAPGTNHQGGAHQVPFNLDEAPPNIDPVHIHYNDLIEPYDPAAPELAQPLPAPLIAAALHDCFGDSASSDDDEPMDDDLSFVMATSTTSPTGCSGSFVVGARQRTGCQTSCRHERLGVTRPPTARCKWRSREASTFLMGGG